MVLTQARPALGGSGLFFNKDKAGDVMSVLLNALFLIVFHKIAVYLKWLHSARFQALAIMFQYFYDLHYTIV